MPVSNNDCWAQCKEQVLAKLAEGKFTCVYGDLKNAKASGGDWMMALCPFHEDSQPSFGFNTKTGQWKCFSGCGKGTVFDYIMKQRSLPFKDVLSGLSDELGVLIPDVTSKVEVVYSYQDHQYNLLFQVVRKPGKKFLQRKPDGKNGWIWNLKGVARVLYRLPELLEKPDDPVYIVEGEKDADRLLDLGLLATTSPGGAGNWQSSFNEVLNDRSIIILPDNDAPGRDHATKVAQSLNDKATSVKILELPDLPKKGDVSDWLEAGGSKAKLATLVADTAVWEPKKTDQGKPIIQLSGTQLAEVLDKVWNLIFKANDPPSLFLSSGGLSRINLSEDTPSIELLDDPKAYGVLIRLANWYTHRSGKDIPCKPPKEIARDILANPNIDLPKLESVITTPIFDKSWLLLNQPGYQPEARVWLLESSKAEGIDVPLTPSKEEVTWAKSLILDDLLFDFPFYSTKSDRTHAVAALLLPFARRMITGPTPMHMIEAPTPGTGKSLLADLISIIFTGRSCESTTITRNEDESRKKLTAILSRGAPIVVIDNLQGGMDSAQISAAITSTIWSDRILGKTQMVQFPNMAVWLVTANNPKLSMEIARRCIRIRMEPKEERPWERDNFKHDPIREWAESNRKELIRAVLILIQSWIAAGGPLGQKTLGSFESWSRIIGGIVTHHEIEGFLKDTEDFYRAADSESGEWWAFITAWQEEHKSDPMTASQLMALAESRELISFAYAARSEHAQKVRFGRALSSLRGRKFGNFQVTTGTDSHKKTKTYRLVPVEVGLFGGKK